MEQTQVAVFEASKLARKDIRAAAATLSDDEARYLVTYYYIMQEDRKRFNNQERTLAKEETPNVLLTYFGLQAEGAEETVKKALDDYTNTKPIGVWLKSVYGIGPVIAAGLMAHIDITKAPTAGHIWAFAGLDPTKKWEKGQKRPFNAELKTLCWKLGQSFMKFSGKPECRYGQLYLERKEYEVKRNETGGNVALAASLLPKYDKKTDAYKHLELGKLPPAQIDARARRWAVKIFLSHLQAVWYEMHFGVKPPAPFAIAILGHAHMIAP